VQSDSEIVKRVLSGDIEAYSDLVRRYERSARAVAWVVLRDEHSAADVAQEAFVVAFAKLARLRTAAHYGRWLMRIVRRQAVRAARGRRATVSLETVPADSAPASCDGISGGESREEQQKLLATINRLPRNERLAIMLRYFEDYDTRAIAAATGCAESAVFKRLSRARQRLRRWLTEEDKCSKVNGRRG
jgi:RNA polymerase sigma-70 factor, ECF subfamily